MSSERNSWKMNLVLVLVSTFVAGGLTVSAGEAFLRYRERNRALPPEVMPGLYYPHSRHRHALVRSTNYYGWITVNSHGFRGREITMSPLPGVLRIMTVGSSTTFDQGVTGDDRTWPARMEARLAQLRPDRRVEVINAGVPGYRMLDHVIRLETELYAFRPDLIILYESHNDLETALRVPLDWSPTPEESEPMTPWTQWLSRHSLLFSKGTARLITLRDRAHHHPDAAETRQRTLHGAADFERLVGAFLAEAGALGIPVVLPGVAHVSGQGNLTENDPDILMLWQSIASPQGILEGYAAFDRALRRQAERFGATYLPTDGFGLRGPQWYVPNDPLHFNNAGAERMGLNVAESLNASGLLDEIWRGPRAPSAKAPPQASGGRLRSQEGEAAQPRR
jgi:lysophospholipase L1-like esterase